MLRDVRLTMQSTLPQRLTDNYFMKLNSNTQIPFTNHHYFTRHHQNSMVKERN
jgi:hypothetical protein